MKKNRVLLLAALAAGALAIAGCANESPPSPKHSRNDPAVVNASGLIQQGIYDGALTHPPAGVSMTASGSTYIYTFVNYAASAYPGLSMSGSLIDSSTLDGVFSFKNSEVSVVQFKGISNGPDTGTILYVFSDHSMWELDYLTKSFTEL